MDLRYAYFFGVLVYGIIWTALYFHKPHCRREMIFISLPFGFLGFFLEPLYVKDWWMPLTLTGTIPGIEDFLYGFFLGGIAAVLVDSLREKTIRHTKLEQHKRKRRLHLFYFASFLCVLLFYALYYIFHLNTLIISIVFFILVMGAIDYFRPDLRLHSLYAGASLVLVSIPVYLTVTALFPGWIEAFWYFAFFPRIIFAGIPLEDILFLFAFGAAVGPLYEFWQEGRLRKK